MGEQETAENVGDRRPRKILFISVHLERAPFAYPLAAVLLETCIRSRDAGENRYSTGRLDLYLEDPVLPAAVRAAAEKPDIAAFSVAVWNRDYSLRLMEELKSLLPEILIIAGGPEVTADPRFFRDHPLISWMVPGEGEEALLEWLDRLSREEPSGNGIVPRRVENLESLPSPLLFGTSDLPGYTGFLWELSRGCPFACDFCFESRGAGKVRRFSLERIRKELEILARSGISQVFVLDPTFNLDRRRARSVLEMIREAAPHIHFTFEVRSEYLNPPLAELFGEISCSVQIGLQSAHPEVLAGVNRTLDREDFRRKIRLLQESGAVYGFDLIYGLPGDSLEGFRESLEFVLDLLPNHVDIFPLSVLKGTALYDRAEELQLQYLDTRPYTVTSAPGWTPEDLKEAGQLAEAFDLLYNRGKAVSWFHLAAENLDLAPAELIREFAVWQEGLPGPEGEKSGELSAPELRRAFLTGQFALRDRDREGRLAADLAAFLSEDQEVSGEFDLEAVMELLESGVTDLSEILFFG